MTKLNIEEILVSIANSSGWVVNQANTGGTILASGSISIVNSAGWSVGVGSTSIVNSAGWVVSIANSAGWLVGVGSTSIVNSAGWVVSIANSAGWGVGVGSTNIINSAGWVVAVSNTIGIGVNIQNSAGWVMSASSTILNSAGWVVSVANTAGQTTNIINSAGWIIYTIDSRPTGTAISTIASTVGTVVLASVNANRRTFSAYNRSTNPLFLKLGSGAKTTDFTLMMVASGYYELQNPVYTGVITGVWGTANGDAQITEGT